MAIRFVERKPGREAAAVETDAATEPPAVADAAPSVAVKPPKRRRTASGPTSGAVPPDLSEHAGSEPPSDAPDPSADGVLPGLAPPARPPKRRRSRMMGFG